MWFHDTVSTLVVGRQRSWQFIARQEKSISRLDKLERRAEKMESRVEALTKDQNDIVHNGA